MKSLASLSHDFRTPPTKRNVVTHASRHIAMQTLARGESRARRALSADPRAARGSRLTRTQSPPDHNRVRLPVRDAARRVAETAAAFAASGLLRGRPARSAPVVAMLAVAAAAVPMIVLARPRPTALRVLLSRRATAAALALLAALCAAHVLALLVAVRAIGPTRAIVAFGAQFPLVAVLTASAGGWFMLDRRRPNLAVLLAALALALLAYDATGGRAPFVGAQRVRDRVLHTRAGRAVHERIRKLGVQVGKRAGFVTKVSLIAQLPPIPVPPPPQPPGAILANVRPADEGHGAPDALTQDSAPNVLSKGDTFDRDLQDNSVDKAPPEAQIDQVSENGESEGKRRRLLAVVKDEELSIGDSEQTTVQEVARVILTHNDLSQVEPDSPARNDNPPNSSGTNAGKRDATHPDVPVGDVELHEKGGNLEVVGTEDSANRNNAQSTALSSALGVLLAAGSCVGSRMSQEVLVRLEPDFGDWALANACIFALSAAILAPICCIFMSTENWSSALGVNADESIFVELIPKSALFGVLFLFVPVLLTCMGRNGFPFHYHPPHRTGSKVSPAGSGAVAWATLAGAEGSSEIAFPLYACTLFAVFVLKIVCAFAFDASDSFSWFTVLASLVLLLATQLLSTSASQITSRPSIERPIGSPALNSEVKPFVRTAAVRLRQVAKTLNTLSHALGSTVRTFVVQTRANKASWQVLNFLVLQFGMALVETLYAGLTHSVGLISISADNFFCCFALAIGLVAMRTTSRKPSPVYSYGLTRFESLCGFTNGILLVYVAVLVVLEALDRVLNPGDIDASHTFTVCSFGVLGNALGLYFFPPESRRENHNVQGIYLHIWGNTLAFASMAVSAALAVVMPHWTSADLTVAIIVATVMVACAVPLIIRSARLLLLRPTTEKAPELESLSVRLEQIEGVVSVTALRAWNLTPSCLVASVRLAVAASHTGDDGDVLFHARSLFASMGVPASQTTVQISRVERDHAPPVLLHKRSQSGVVETTAELEGLYIPGGRREALARDGSATMRL